MGGCRDLDALPELLRLRLAVISLPLPPLRERREDILPLFRSFLDVRARQDGRTVPMLERGAEKELLQCAWPGNLAQLAWAVASAWRATTGPVLAPLPLERLHPAGPGAPQRASGRAAGAPEAHRADTGGDRADGALVLPWPVPGTLADMLAAVSRAAEAALLRKSLEGQRRDPARVAQALGLSPRRFAGVLREHRISLEDE